MALSWTNIAMCVALHGGACVSFADATYDSWIQVNNPLAHELTTGPEIIDAVVSTPSTPTQPSSGKVDVFAAGAGTGGTITGVSRAIKKTHNPQCFVVGIDPASPPLITFHSSLTNETSERKHSCLSRQPQCRKRRRRLRRRRHRVRLHP
jgi:cysteine synthase